MMKRIPFIIPVLVLLTALSARATDYSYSLGGLFGLSTLTGGDSAKYTLQKNFGGSFGYRLSDRWTLDLSATVLRNYNDPGASSSFQLGADKNAATRRWKATRLGLRFDRLLFHPDHHVNLVFGFGGGLMLWSIVDPAADTAINVLGPHDETVDYSASEIFVGARGGFNVTLAPKWALQLAVQADYLTNWGADFASDVRSSRNRWQVGPSIGLSFFFGGAPRESSWRSTTNWTSPAIANREPVRSDIIDSDGDGVADDMDKCPETPPGMAVDKNGCSVDADGDGVNDAFDDCPGTDRRAAGHVDIHGCPVDSDFDGIPDYLDACPNNQIGARVDSTGCPVDSDKDGVPDGLDDCPNTLYGVPVDKYGCIDLSMFAAPMVLNIDYAPGSFEIDPRNRDRLKDLARVLNVVPEIKLEINGYSDNIGTDAANQALSEKRARRVRDYLVALGIADERIKVFGRGETNFVASNDTAEGRAKNRRIEIVFYR
jgi:outer membrane protein OmpA-like peptidoglycan-associated protein